MYVRMRPSPTTESGWESEDPSTYVQGHMFTKGYNAARIGGLIAHEEIHQGGRDNPSHTTGIANSTQTNCTFDPF